MRKVTCRTCAKRSGWLVAIPALALVPKCPLCWVSYLAIVEAAALSRSSVIGCCLLAILSLIGSAAILWKRHRRTSLATAKCSVFDAATGTAGPEVPLIEEAAVFRGEMAFCGIHIERDAEARSVPNVDEPFLDDRIR
jgi:hypothetical protein